MVVISQIKAESISKLILNRMVPSSEFCTAKLALLRKDVAAYPMCDMISLPTRKDSIKWPVCHRGFIITRVNED